MPILTQSLVIGNTVVPVYVSAAEYDLLLQIRDGNKVKGNFIDLKKLAAKGLIKSISSGGFIVTPLGTTFLTNA